MANDRVEIAGSVVQHAPGERALGAAHPGTPVSATVVIRRHAGEDNSGALLSGNFRPVSRSEAEEQTGADEQDIQAVEDFARAHDLQVTEADPAKRTVKLQGAAANFNAAFGIQLRWADQASAGPYLTYDGSLTIPQPLAGRVLAVLGLDQKPIARHAGEVS